MMKRLNTDTKTLGFDELEGTEGGLAAANGLVGPEGPSGIKGRQMRAHIREVVLER